MMVENELIKKVLQNKVKRIKTIPDSDKCSKFLHDIFQLLFVKDINSETEIILLEDDYRKVLSNLSSILQSVVKDQDDIQVQLQLFTEALPPIYDTLLKDAEALLSTDPAAKSIEEILVAYPGFLATVVYRISHQLYKQGILVLPRFFTEYAHSKTGIDIHPGARIGHSFAIDHGTGVVIGETSVIGDNVKIYQGVTLGALSVSKDEASSKRHPTIEDNVVIYAGATILGGKTIIGKGSIIGGNVWLTYSVPPNSVVYHKSEVHVKDNNPFPEPLNFVI